MKRIAILLAIFSSIVGCALAPIPSEFARVERSSSGESIDPNMVRLTIFNSSGGLSHGLDNTGHLNMKIDGKAVGYIPMKRFVIIDASLGAHNVYLEHLDVWMMKSNHQIEVSPTAKGIRVFATLVSNNLEVVEELPPDFDRVYQPAE